jgi:iron complex outermembrane receptor protein
MSVWAGLRHSRLDRRSIATDGTAATAYRESFTTPWLAISQAIDATGLVYVSWGRGIESEVAPNLPRYANANRALPVLQSRQIEIGFKHRNATLDWSVAGFDIRRPQWSDFGACDDTAGSCTREIDGNTRHRGIEAEVEWRAGPWNLRASAIKLRARRFDAADTRLNGLRPTNVPELSLKAQAAYNVAAIPGLAVLAFVTHEGERIVLPDNSIGTPGWTRIDLGARYSQRLGQHTVVWRIGVDNLADTRAWKEAPYQFSHAYLYPLAPRGVHLSAQIGF